MAKDMLGEVVKNLVNVPTEAHGTLMDLMEKLSSDSKWLPALKKTLRMENPWSGTIVPSSEDPFRETGELTIHIPALPRPTLEELRKIFPRIKEIDRDTSPTGPITLRLGTVIRFSGEQIDYAEYEQRIASKLDVLLGFQQAEWLQEHRWEFPALTTLLFSEIHIDFPGLIVVGLDGVRHCPFMDLNGMRFDQYWDWLGRFSRQGGRVAISDK